MGSAGLAPTLCLTIVLPSSSADSSLGGCRQALAPVKAMTLRPPLSDVRHDGCTFDQTRPLKRPLQHADGAIADLLNIAQISGDGRWISQPVKLKPTLAGVPQYEQPASPTMPQRHSASNESVQAALPEGQMPWLSRSVQLRPTGMPQHEQPTFSSMPQRQPASNEFAQAALPEEQMPWLSRSFQLKPTVMPQHEQPTSSSMPQRQPASSEFAQAALPEEQMPWLSRSFQLKPTVMPQHEQPTSSSMPQRQPASSEFAQAALPEEQMPWLSRSVQLKPTGMPQLEQPTASSSMPQRQPASNELFAQAALPEEQMNRLPECTGVQQQHDPFAEALARQELLTICAQITRLQSQERLNEKSIEDIQRQGVLANRQLDVSRDSLTATERRIVALTSTVDLLATSLDNILGCSGDPPTSPVF